MLLYVLIASLQERVFAQITPDDTLPNNSSVTREGNTFNITGGTQAGNNLFHSFGEFSVPSGGAATFNNALDIQNIISRVTGGSVSNIDGLIRASGTANLFLINPNGIIFGKDARLDIGGSFLASTASSLNFADGTQFSTTSSQTTPLLSISVPVGLQYGGTEGNIRNQSQATDSGETVGLQVQPGKTLAMVGGDVTLNGGILFAPAGRVELGGLAEAGTVGLNIDSNNLSLSFPEQIAPASVSLNNINIATSKLRTIEDLPSQGQPSLKQGGNIIVNADNLSVLGTALYTTAYDDAGDVEINASGKVSLEESSISTWSLLGKGGDITIKAKELSLVNTNLELMKYFGDYTGRAEINVSGKVALQDSLVGTFDGSSGGEIIVNTGSLYLNNSFLSLIEASSRTDGAISVKSDSFIVLDNKSAIRMNSIGGWGDSVFIETDSLTLTNGSSISMDFNGSYKGGAGEILIHANSLSLEHGGFISADSAFRSGGGVRLRGRDSLLMSSLTMRGRDSRISVVSNDDIFFEDGDDPYDTFKFYPPQAIGGDVDIFTQELIIKDEAGITVSNNLTEKTEVLGEDYKERIFSYGFIKTVCNCEVPVMGGNLSIWANSLILNGGAFLLAETASGKGGNIMLNLQDLMLLRRNSQISTTTGTAQQPGDGGNIAITAPNAFIIAAPTENSDITANAFSGSGGRITINATSIYGIAPLSRGDLQRLSPNLDPSQVPTSDITAISQTSPNLTGTIELTTPEIDPDSGLVELPTVPVDTQVAQGCQSPGYAQSSFVINGRGGLPPNPKDILTPEAPQIDWVSVKPSNKNRSLPPVTSKPTASTPKRIVEATGVTLNESGQIVLSANSSSVSPHTSRQNSIQCHGS